jgi:hypothetical protein
VLIVLDCGVLENLLQHVRVIVIEQTKRMESSEERHHPAFSAVEGGLQLTVDRNTNDVALLRFFKDVAIRRGVPTDGRIF